MAIENRQGAIWWSKQSAKGSPSATAFRRGRHTAGDLTVNPDLGSENYTDGERFNNAQSFVNSVQGNGNPTFQAQCGVVGHLAYLMSGQETVTGAGDPFTHVATPANTGSFWSTWFKRVGQAVGPLRERYNDCKLISLRIEGSSAAKIVKVTPTFVSLDAGEVWASDPVAVEETGNPMVYTEAVGTFRIAVASAEAVFKGHSSFAFQINDAVAPWFGDDVVPHDITFGVGNIVIENITLLVDAAGLGIYNELIYGSASPAAGTKPRKDVPALGSYNFDLLRGSTREIKVELPGVQWNPDVAVPLNPDGGAVELTLGAEARKSGSNPMYRITTKSADPAYT